MCCMWVYVLSTCRHNGSVYDVHACQLTAFQPEQEIIELAERPASLPHKHKHDKEHREHHKSDKVEREQRLLAMMEEVVLLLF